MSGMASFGKNPLTSSHGDSLTDQSFESLKSKEISDFQSPISDIKFHSAELTNPNSSGWDVKTSSEISPDGKAFHSDTLAKTGGTEKINGGTVEYHGLNEQHSSGSHHGDDKNFIKKANESTKTQLEERVVVGDENSGLTEIKQSSSSTSSRTQYIASSNTSDFDNDQRNKMKYLEDDGYNRHKLQKEKTQKHHEESEYISSSKQQQQIKQNKDFLDDNKEYMKLDKNSAEYQQRVQFLMAQQGEIVSNTVEYIKPNVKMITIVKRLPDGTMVKTKNYETDGSNRNVGNVSHKTYEKNTSEEIRLRENREQLRRQSTVDQVDAIHHDRNQRTKDFIQTERNNSPSYNVTYPNDDEQKENITRERRSEFIEEVEEHSQRKSKHVPDFTTHGFPSVRAEIPTRDSRPRVSQPIHDSRQKQEIITEKSHAHHETETVYSSTKHREPKPDFSTHGFPSVRSETPTRDAGPRKSQPIRDSPKNYEPTQDYTAPDSPSKKPNRSSQDFVTEKSHARHETETVYSSTKHKDSKPDFSTHGFPSVRVETPTRDAGSRKSQPIRDSPKNYEPTQDYTAPDSPSKKPNRSSQDFVTEKSHAHHETETVYSSTINKKKKDVQNKIEQEDLSLRKPHPIEGFSTHGFPSVRPDTPTQEFPTDRPNSRQKDYSSNETHKLTSKQVESHDEFITQADYIHTEVTDGRRSKYPDEDVPQMFYADLSSYKSHPKSDFIRNELPSVKTSSSSKEIKSLTTATKTTKSDFSTHGFPSVKSPERPTSKSLKLSKDTQLDDTSTVKSHNSTDISFHKSETKVDAAHQAFASSLRCSSPADGTRRDSFSSNQKHQTSIRTSVGSVKSIHNRNVRSPSHESISPSEGSRISTTTITRHISGKHTPSSVKKSPTGAKQTLIKTKITNSSNNIASKTQMTTKNTTQNSIGIKKSTVSSVQPKTDSLITKTTKQFLINEPLTNTNITKHTFSENNATAYNGNEVIEEPIIKKSYYRLGPSANQSQSFGKKNSSTKNTN